MARAIDSIANVKKRNHISTKIQPKEQLRHKRSQTKVKTGSEKECAGEQEIYRNKFHLQHNVRTLQG